MCGKKDKLFVCFVEGSEMQLCSGCKSYGKVLRQVRVNNGNNNSNDNNINTGFSARKPKDEEVLQLVVDDYQVIIKQARERLNLRQEDLAKKIAEKESTIHKIESGHLAPSIILARKFEYFLSIKLIEEHVEKHERKKDIKNAGPLTIGDLIKIKKK